METDKELTALAAKAAGLTVEWSESWGCFQRDARPVSPGYSEWLLWRPLSDDGDALRLAVKLGLEVYEGSSDGTAQAWVGWFAPNKRTRYLCEPHGSDPYAAARRAIVRAAAEVAKANNS
jgi:hypothetical protein